MNAYEKTTIRRVLEPLHAAIKEAVADRENRGKSTVLPDYWERVVKAAEGLEQLDLGEGDGQVVAD